MSPLKPVVLYRPLALALALAIAGVGASLHAAESAQAPASAPASSTPPSIESAKKEFDALKAAREAAQRGQGSGALPRMTVPELQIGLGSDPRPAQGTKANPATDPTKKSANWLLDGMAREAARRDGDRGRAPNSNARDRREPTTRESGAAGPTLADGVPVEAGSLTDPQSGPSSARDALDTAQSEKEKTSEAPNPLNRYLAEWMTPRDYATLKPSLTEGLGADGSGRGGLGDVALPASMGGGLSGVTLPGGITAPDTIAAGSKAASPTIAPPRENPYLQSFALPSAPATSLPATPPPPAPSSAAPVLSPLPSPAPVNPAPKPAVPDFARPAQDEKYFKQLKRF